MPEYEALLSRFTGLGAQVLGVSVDNTFSNAAWANSLGGITYLLLSDFWPHGETARQYGTLLEDRGITARTVFVIDKRGTIAFVERQQLDEPPDPEVLLDALRGLQ